MHFVLRSVVIATCLMNTPLTYAATPIDLSKHSTSFLKKYISAMHSVSIASAVSNNSNLDQIKEINRNADQENMTHIRVQQQYRGFPVWGGDAVLHVPNTQHSKRSLMSEVMSPSSSTKMNGVLYQNLNRDLQNSPLIIFTQAQAELAFQKVAELSRSAYLATELKPVINKLIVYVDQANQAHWAFLVSVYINEATANKIPAKPVYIVDALTFHVYKSWNDMRGAKEIVNGGGFGGNDKNSEKLQYDGLQGHLKPFLITHDTRANNCLMLNNDVELHDGRGMKNIMSYHCEFQDNEHNNVFWDGSMDAVNGGYSPANDALFAGSIVQQLYQNWLNVPMLKTREGKPMVLKMFAHVGKNWENAAWDPEKEEVRLGDGAKRFYPLTSLDIIAHEVSHGFTSQHSNLVYADQSGSMDEAFSDMTAQAAEFFSENKNSWMIGASIVKARDSALRYMDKPSKDCSGRQPGDACSIDSAAQYPYLEQTSYQYNKDEGEDSRQSYIVHLASGVFNHAFYLLATTPGWDTKKAFIVMAQANANYWTQTSSFIQGACGVMKAAADYHYATVDVANAFTKVGIDTQSC